MKKLLEDVRLEFAIQLLYDYINIINIKMKITTNKEKLKLLQSQKEKLKKGVKTLYNGSEKEISSVIEIYSPIVQQYYNRKENKNGH